MKKFILGLVACSLLICVEALEAGKCGEQIITPVGGFHLDNTTLFAGKNCTWYIMPPVSNKTETKINLFITFLYLHEDDTLAVYKDEKDVGNESLSIINPLRRQNGSVTIITDAKVLIIELKGTDKAYQRVCEGVYQAQDCAFTIPPTLKVIHSPLVVTINPSEDLSNADCRYTYQNDASHYINTMSFAFEEFNFTTSEVTLKDTTQDGPYKSKLPIEFFNKDYHHPMTIEVNMKVPTNDSFILRMQMVNKISGFQLLTSPVTSFNSPEQMFDNDTIVYECHWVFRHDSNILGLVLDQLNLEDPFDIIAINDGGSELSPPLMQVTTSNRNISRNQMIRATGPYLWVGFKTRSFASRMSANITLHMQGGHHKGSGTIEGKGTDGNDSVYLLEVEENKVVLLNFTKSDFPPPAALSIYDGFDKTNLLATLHGNVWYPVMSRSNKMMVIATNFVGASFEATFKGASPGCLHMSTFSNENYVLSGNCNSTCLWVIPPQDRPGSVLLLDIQFLSLSKDDEITLYKLDSSKALGGISSSANRVPQLAIPANIGGLVEISRAPCATKSDDVVLVGHSSYLPACGKDFTLTPGAEFQITSPLYPDTYPIFDSCRWNVTTGKDDLLHLAFKSLQLAPNHCVKVTQPDNKTQVYEGNELKEDLLVTGGAIVEFDSSNCKSGKAEALLLSSDGFVLNGTVTNCGGVLSGKANGDFTVPVNKSLCIWKLSIPDTESSYISYTVKKKDEKGNFKLSVYDGSSVRDAPITNDTAAEISSRTSNLIFVYRSIDATKPSSVLDITYTTQKCNKTMVCGNKICIHPDWLCNGINDCGDFTDEKNCDFVPVPHDDVSYTGYSPVTFWVVVILIFVIGAAVGLGVPYAYERYKNGQYRRFGDISVIE